MRSLLSVFLLCFGLLFAPAFGHTAPTPTCFVYIKILPNGEVYVTENLKGFGPRLERPLDTLSRPYSSRSPFVQDPPMEVVSVKVNGTLRQTDAVKRNYYDVTSSTLVITSKDSSRQTHDYSVTYKTSSRVLFKSDADRIVWDVWGRGTAGVMLSCAVSLPEGAKVLKQEARLGHETGGHKPVKSWIAKDGAALFKAMEPLGEGESFEVAVEWAKGFVASDGTEAMVSTVNKAMWALFAFLLAACGGLWFVFGRDPHPKAPTPLFYPPEGPDGRPLSPAAMAYIRNAAYLPSRGFAALLMNLAAQNMVELKGTGTRKDPYTIYTPEKTAEKLDEEGMRTVEAQAMNGAPSSTAEDRIPSEGTTQRARRRWLEALDAGRGFDDAEVQVYRRIFNLDGKNVDDKPSHFVTLDGDSPWLIASMREVAYVELARLYRSLWNLRTSLVLFLFLLCYGSVMGLQAWLWAEFGGDMYVTLAVTAAVGLLCMACRMLAGSAHRMWMKWQEMGKLNLAAMGLYAFLFPVILLYDVLLSPGFGFPLQNIMEGWGGLRIALWIGLAGWLLFKVKSLPEVLLRPWQLLAFILMFFLSGGLVFTFSGFSGIANLAFLGILLMPLAFMPIMKQPAKRAMPILADIEGFAMYIGAAEAQRMNFLNPPDRTPEEFHRILPYAVALGLEEAWGAQFSDMFKQMRFQTPLAALSEYEHRMNGDETF